MEILWKTTVFVVLDDPLETLRKMCLSTTFPHQEIRWNYGTLRNAKVSSVGCRITYQSTSLNPFPFLNTHYSHIILITTASLHRMNLMQILTTSSQHGKCPNTDIFPYSDRIRKFDPANTRIQSEYKPNGPGKTD